MENFTSHPCVYEQDRESILDLLLAYRLATSIHHYLTSWRVRLLLTSRVWEPELDTRLWQTPTGQVAGLAFLWRRKLTSPYLVLERFIHPAFANLGLGSTMLAWGEQRARLVAAQQAQPLTIYSSQVAFQGQVEGDAESFGFTPSVPDPADHIVYLARPIQEDLPTPVLPPGYILRPLQGMEELEAYQSLYGFAKVNPQHLREQLDSKEYRHLVVVDPQGEFAAYCECSVCRAEWRAGVPRLGWIDYIETRPERQKQGLGQAVLWTGLACLQDWGAELAMLVTASSNAPALAFYQKTGFEPAQVDEPRGYKKLF